jgi:hypothetical protein
MSKIAENLGREVEKVVRKAALRVDQVVVMGTPVDTGRARGGWILTIGKPSSEGPPDTPLDPGGGSAMAQAVSASKGFKAGKGVLGSIFITNNVEYIQALEDGRSAQAPAGMVKQGVDAGADLVRKARIQIGR